MSKRSYHEAAHAIQSGVAAKMALEPSDTSPKHLRVGVNMAMIDSAAIATVLLRKGVFTEEEYRQALSELANKEVDKYEEELTELTGAKVSLA